MITHGELVANQQQLDADPGFTFKDHGGILWDFTGAVRFDHSAAKFAQEAEAWLSPIQIRRALVAKPGSDVAKFLSLWVLHRAVRHDPLVQLFATVEQAQHWLDQPGRT